jgi:regulator of sigma E protease
MEKLVAILGLGVLIFLHELGHLLVARATGLPVTRFSIGMGPVIWSRTWGGVEWALSALPFGGYVIFDGESEEYERADPWRKLLTSLGGPAANLLVGALLYIAAASVASHSVALGAGLEKVVHAVDQLGSTLQMLFSGKLGIKDLGGPVMMVRAGASLVSNPAHFLSYLGFLSVNLAVFNMLPIPILDGGQILLTLATAISGRAPSRKIQIAMYVSTIALAGLMVWVTVQDVSRLL